MIALISPVDAEDPVMLGIRGAFSAFAPVSEETSSIVRSTAAELLARYVKIRNGNYQLQYTPVSESRWTEIQGLQLTRVTAQAVSMADQANGIAESYVVSIDAEMFHNYDGKTTKWTQWYNGRNFSIPPCIQVTLGTNGQWRAQSPMLSSFVAFTAHGDPGLIPHDTKPAVSAQAKAAAPQVGIPQQTTAPSSQAPAKSLPKPGDPMGAAVHQIMTTVLTIAIFIVMLGIFPAVIRYIYRKNRKSSDQQKGVTVPSRFPPPQPAAMPPPLPTSHSSGKIGIIEGRTHLLTAAEQSFFAVLEPIVRPFCSISSKVRLADLFDVRQGRGWQSAFNKISNKHIDFVLTEPGTSRILCAIELDDSSHNRPDRSERDDFVNELFASQGLPLLRVPCAWTYYPPALRDELAKAGVPLSNAT